MEKGTFYIVGVGPGDPELLTLKAVKIIEACDLIAAPLSSEGRMTALEIVNGAVKVPEEKIVPVSFPMLRKEEDRWNNYREVAANMAGYLDKGLDIAMINLGDVSVYSTACYVLKEVKKLGYNVEMIPGITSFCAIAARLKDSLTEMKEEMHVIPASGVSVDEALKLHGTKILMKSGKSIHDTVKAIIDKGLLDKAVMVQDCGMETERIFTDLSDLPDNIGYFSTIIVKE